MTNEEIFYKIKSGEIEFYQFDIFVEVEKQKSFTEGSKSGYIAALKSDTKFLDTAND